MSYLPGVPDMNPAPDEVAQPAGRSSRTQHLGTVVGRTGAGISSIGGGDPLMHSFGHYGKSSPPGLGAMTGSRLIRGTSMGKNIRRGALGPGKMGAAGASTKYSMNSMDTE